MARDIFKFVILFCTALLCAQTNQNGIQDLNAEKMVAKVQVKGAYARVDFSKRVGAIKALHGVNNSPIRLNREIPEMREAGIPYVRLHDSIGWYGGAKFVDIQNVFPNFDADPNDPASYDFAMTDAYIASLVKSGVKIFYRLGSTIENNWRIKAYRIYPPKDNLKWAKICEGIIKHYNEGWANGFHYNIEYWEVWNEPENPPMWQGTKEEFFELYKVAAMYLKKRFPNIRVGGYAGCGFYAVNRPNMSPFYKGFVTWFEDFVKFTKANSIPFDFFSWHLYTRDPEEVALHANYVRETLDKGGLQKVENIFNEWNLHTLNGNAQERQTNSGAAFTAATFCVLQASSVDKAMYYDALPTRSYCGLFDFPNQRPTKTFFAFKAFNKLYELGQAVECDSSRDMGIYVCAAMSKDGSKRMALVVNNSDSAKRVKTIFEGKVTRCVVIDADFTFTEYNCIAQNGTLQMSPKSVVLLEIEQ